MTKVIARLRPISPHLFWKTPHYKIQITSALSVLHRGTGAALAILIPLFIILPIIFAAVYSISPYLEIKLQYFIYRLIPLIVFGVLFCLYYHFFNGVRHVYWDMGKNLSNNAVKNSGLKVILFTFLSTCSMYYAFFIEEDLRTDDEEYTLLNDTYVDFSSSHGTEEAILVTTLIGFGFVFYGLRPFIEIFILGFKKVINFFNDLPKAGSFFIKADKYYVSNDGFYHWYLQRIGILFGGSFLFAFLFHAILLYHSVLTPACLTSFVYYGINLEELLDDSTLFLAFSTYRDFLFNDNGTLFYIFESLPSMWAFFASFLSTLYYIPLLLIAGPFIIWHASIGFQAIIKDYVHDVISKSIIVTLIQVAAFAIILVYYSVFSEIFMSVQLIEPYLLPAEFNLQNIIINFIKYLRDIVAQIFIVDTSIGGDDYRPSIAYLEGPSHKPLRDVLLDSGSLSALYQNLSDYYIAMKSWQFCFMFDVLCNYIVHYDVNYMEDCPSITNFKVSLYNYTSWLHLIWGVFVLVLLRPMGLVFFSMYKLILHFFIYIPALIFLPLISADLCDHVCNFIANVAEFIDHLTYLSLGLYTGPFVACGAFRDWLYDDFFMYCLTDFKMTPHRAFEYISLLELFDAMFTVGVLITLCFLPHNLIIKFFPSWYSKKKFYWVNGFALGPTLLIFMNPAEVFSAIVFQTHIVPGTDFFFL